MADNIAISEQPWRKYLTDYNEGLGLVYERFFAPGAWVRECS